jgi:phage terminase small subunit
MPIPKNKDGLTLRQELFVKNYLANGFAPRAAAIAAGYSIKTAHVQAAQLLDNPKVKVLIDTQKEALFNKCDVTAERVVKELALLGFSNMQDYIQVQKDGSAYLDLTELTREQAAAITQLDTETYTDGHGEDAREVKRTRIKLADKKAPLELLGDYLGIFKKSGSSSQVNILINATAVESKLLGS